MKMTILPSKNISHCLQALSSQLHKLDYLNADIKIIVPDKFSLQMEKFIFDALNIECSFNIDITTMNRFCKSILQDANLSTKTINKVGSVILTQKILKNNYGKLKCFSSNNFSYKYSSEVSRTLTQLNSSMADADKMILFRSQNQMLQNKIYDLGILLKEYNAQKSGVLDANDIITQAILNLDKKKFANTNFFFIGFDDFTFQGYALLEHLTQVCQEMFLTTFENDAGNNHYIFPSQVKNRIAKFCEKNNIICNTIYEKYQDNDLKCFLSDNLFSYKKTQHVLNKENKVQLYSALSKEEEIDFVARQIRKDILSGKRYKDFGILCFDLSSYANSIEKTFSKYEIEYYIDSKKSLFDTSIMKFIINLLRLKNGELSNINLIEHITNPYCNLTKQESQQLLKFLTSHNYSGKYNDKNITMENRPLLKNVFDNIDSLVVSKDNFDISAFWQSVQTTYDLQTKIDENNNETDDLYAKKIISQSLSTIGELFEQISMWHKDISLNEAIEIVYNASKEAQINPLPLSLDCVQILDAKDNFTFFDNLYVMNCNQNTCPSYQKDCGIILDEDITNLNNTVPLSPTIQHLNTLSKISALNAVLSFNNNLTISMVLKNDNEKSSVVLELEKKILTPDNISIFPITQAYLKSHNFETNALSRADEAEKFAENQTIMPVQNLNLSKKLFLPKNEISASQLETYFKCPFVHFMNYGLRLSQKETSDLKGSDIGNLFHSLAQDYYAKKIEYKKDPVQFCKYFVLKNLAFNKQNKQNKTLIVNLVEESQRFLKFLEKLDANSKFQPENYAMEYSFSHSLLVDANGQDIKLKGKIDRIDFYDNGFRIIDYKSGKAEPSLKELYYCEKLQLFLYANVAEKIFARDCKGVFYLPIKNKFKKPDDKQIAYKLQGFYLNDSDNIIAMDKNFAKENVYLSDIVNINLKNTQDGTLTPTASDKFLSKQELDKFLQYSQDVSQNTLEEIIGGNITPSPFGEGNKTSCDYCPYLHLCRKNTRDTKTRTATQTIKNTTNFGGQNEQ